VPSRLRRISWCDTIARFLAEMNGDPMPQRPAKGTASPSTCPLLSVVSGGHCSHQHPTILPRTRCHPRRRRSVHAYAALESPIRGTSDRPPVHDQTNQPRRQRQRRRRQERSDSPIDRGEQFANEAQRGALLPQLHDAVLDRRKLGVTDRQRRRECASGIVEALRARGDVGCLVHRISGGLAGVSFP